MVDLNVSDKQRWVIIESALQRLFFQTSMSNAVWHDDTAKKKNKTKKICPTNYHSKYINRKNTNKQLDNLFMSKLTIWQTICHSTYPLCNYCQRFPCKFKDLVLLLQISTGYTGLESWLDQFRINHLRYFTLFVTETCISRQFKGPTSCMTLAIVF